MSHPKSLNLPFGVIICAKSYQFDESYLLPGIWRDVIANQWATWHPWRRLFTPLGIWSAPEQTHLASNLASDIGSDDPFSHQMDLSDARSRITLELINGAEPVSGNSNHSLLIISNESQSTTLLFYCKLPLFPVKSHAVFRMNIIAKSNKSPFHTILYSMTSKMREHY